MKFAELRSPLVLRRSGYGRPALARPRPTALLAVVLAFGALWWSWTCPNGPRFTGAIARLPGRSAAEVQGLRRAVRGWELARTSFTGCRLMSPEAWTAAYGTLGNCLAAPLTQGAGAGLPIRSLQIVGAQAVVAVGSRRGVHAVLHFDRFPWGWRLTAQSEPFPTSS